MQKYASWRAQVCVQRPKERVAMPREVAGKRSVTAYQGPITLLQEHFRVRAYQGPGTML